MRTFFLKAQELSIISGGLKFFFFFIRVSINSSVKMPMYCARPDKKINSFFFFFKQSSILPWSILFTILTPYLAVWTAIQNLSTESFLRSISASSYTVHLWRQNAGKYGLPFWSQSIPMFLLYSTFSITFILVQNWDLSLLLLTFTFHLFVLRLFENWKNILKKLTISK